MSYKEYTVRVYNNGDKYWRLNGKLHREDGPAIEYASGSKHWYLNNKRHREDGPAVEYLDGAKAWYLNGVRYYTQNEWQEELNRRNNSCNNKVVEIDGKKYKLTEV